MICYLIIKEQHTKSTVSSFIKGEFVLHDEHLHCYTNNKEYQNPIHQLRRSEIYFRELLSNLGKNLEIDTSIVFNHPCFTLFKAVRELPIILPTQLMGLANRLNQNGEKLLLAHHQLADQLVSLHVEKNPHTRLPAYDYSQFRKGIFCRDCRGPMQEVNRYFH
jgi:hypothetical protein